MPDTSWTRDIQSRRRSSARKGLAALTLCFALVPLASACSSTSATPKGVIDVVAGTNVWGNIAAQIGGSHVRVTSILTNPNADPHVFESDPQDAVEISQAQLVIANGLGYDDFVNKILDTQSNSSSRLLTVAKVLDVTGNDANPHLWYWTSRLPTVAKAIADRLSALQPSDSAYFHHNAQTFDESLKPLLATINEIKAKYAGTKIAYTERVPGYLVQSAGLVLGTPLSFSLAIEDGTDPSPEDTETFDADLANHVVKVLLYNSQVVDSQTTAIKEKAASAGIPIVGVSETLPPSYKDFQAWQLAQDKELLHALASG